VEEFVTGSRWRLWRRISQIFFLLLFVGLLLFTSLRAIPGTTSDINLRAPVRLDVTAAHWPIDRADAIVNCNMIHISPWTACEGLIAGAERILPVGGVLYLYGPYRIDGRHTASSNEEFDTYLRGQNAAWGIRDLGDVTALAADHGLTFVETVPMPANNLSVIFRRAQ